MRPLSRPACRPSCATSRIPRPLVSSSHRDRGEPAAMVSAWKSRAAAAPIALAMVTVTSRASATLTLDPNADAAFLAEYNNCLTNFSAAGLDAWVVQLENSKNNFSVVEATPGAGSGAAPLNQKATSHGPPGTGAVIHWDFTS